MGLARLKDVALEKVLIAFLRPKIERYGELQKLTLDTSKHLLTAEVHLHGEKDSLIISRARYRIETKGEHTLLIIYDVKASKEWVHNLVEDHFNQIELKVPALVRKMLGA